MTKYWFQLKELWTFRNELLSLSLYINVETQLREQVSRIMFNPAQSDITL